MITSDGNPVKRYYLIYDFQRAFDGTAAAQRLHFSGGHEALTIKQPQREGRGLEGGYRLSAGLSFLLDLDHADIAFGLIIVEKDVKIRHKGQDNSPMSLQPIQQILGG